MAKGIVSTLASSSSSHDLPPQHAQQSAGIQSIIVFIFALNVMLGSGFLSIPYALYHTGLVAGCFLLLCVATISCLTAIWVLEVICRAQALEYWLQTLPKDAINEASNQLSGSSNQYSYSSYPTFEISSTRKFEISELCEIFLGKCGKIMYIAILGIYLLIICWAYATIAASSWASNIPWNISSDSLVCNGDEFTDALLPASTSCQNTYHFYLLVFTIIVVPLSCLEFVEQKYIQVFMTFFRLIAVLLMIVFSLIDVHDEGKGPNNKSTNVTLDSGAETDQTNTEHSAFTFGIVGWSVSIPVFVYSLMLHHYIPQLATSALRKDKLNKLFMSLFGMATCIYCLFGAIVAQTFHSSRLLENAALIWTPTHSNISFGYQLIACIIVFFPSFDVTSLFPLVIITLTNNIYTVMTGRDITSDIMLEQTRRWRVIVLRTMTASIPLIGAVFITDLIYIIKYAGVCGYVLGIIFPALLQIYSRKECRKVFANHFLYKDRRTEVADAIGFSWYGAVQHPRFKRKYTKSDYVRKDTPYSSLASFTTYAVTVCIIAGFLLVYTLVGHVLCEVQPHICYQS